MSHAPAVPETYELTGDHVRQTLQTVGRRKLASDAFQRLRISDGFSHARAFAFLLSLLLVEGLIAVVGLGVATGSSAFSRTVVNLIEGVAPGPAGQLLTSAVRQAQETGSHQQYTVLLLALGAAVITGTSALGQFERACNRMYGVEQDRSTAKKYGRAFVLAVTAGVISALGVVMLVLGQPISNEIDDSFLGVVWDVLRWPIALLLIGLAATLLLKFSPNRHQPNVSWLMYGAAITMALVVVSSLLLALFFRWSTTFGDTYGPLAGMVALLLWCLLISIASAYGIALTAQLEFVRSGGTSVDLRQEQPVTTSRL